MKNEFAYIDHFDEQTRDGSLVLRIPGAMSKAELLKWFAIQLKFPEYYGENWDALFDCLTDLSWIKEEEIILFHKKLPLNNPKSELQAYLDVLLHTARSWKDDPLHNMIIVFDASLRPAIEECAKDLRE